MAEIRQRYRIVEFAVFGSTARVDLCPGSDIDIYLKFEAGTHPGMGYFGLEDELRLISAGRWIWRGNHCSSPSPAKRCPGLAFAAQARPPDRTRGLEGGARLI
ncbi:MAG: nucleotidyltransferase domain-containing protein [Bryobacterales bacterium]|nr:nucleotidyltransferase domain-containing protein [Bryobacterales bacterium]